MRIDIIVVYTPRYRFGHEHNFVPPLSGIHLAALTPRRCEVRVIHQQVEQVPLDTDADLVALSYYSGFAPEARRLAFLFKSRGKCVVGGGPHATFAPHEALEYCDAIVRGEAEESWGRLLNDFENGRLERIYHSPAPALENLPAPRYDLLSPRFFIPRVVQATRGCPFACSFCSVPALNPGFRMRPVEDVLSDISCNDFKHWWQRKIVWFWDDNLTVRRTYAKALFSGMTRHRKWWLTQASMDIACDEELLTLMRRSGCIGVFFGIESFRSDSLDDAGKPQNKAACYREKVRTLHRHGICVMAGLISGFDHDTPESILEMSTRLEEIGVDVPFISVLTPFPGTALYDQYLAEGRMIEERGWQFYNGYNVSFKPGNMAPDELLAAHRALWRSAFSPRAVLRRVLRGLFTLRLGALLMSSCMNLFYGLKAWRGNLPRDMSAAQTEGVTAGEVKQSPAFQEGDCRARLRRARNDTLKPASLPVPPR
jgi:radical SAM superfamily enzyme YgiQ (UPF0313 family)